MKRQSLRFQLSTWYALLFSAIFVCFGLFICVAVRHLLQNNLRGNLIRRTHQLAESVLAIEGGNDLTNLAVEVENRLTPELSGRFVRVTQLNGAARKLLYISGTPKDASFDPQEIGRGNDLKHESTRIEVLGDRRQVLIAALPYSANGSAYLIEIGSSLATINAVLRQIELALLLTAPFVLLSLVCGAYLLVGRALAPVAALAGSAEQITLQNLDEKLPVHETGDELQSLALALNRMIARIHDSFEYTQRFIADASHELRTPLTAMRGELELLLEAGELPFDTRERIASTLEEVERLSNLVEGLLSLSRLDVGAAQGESVTFDLGKLAASVAEQMELLAEDKNISLRSECASAVPVRGDRARLKQVVVNLLDNAIKYTPPGGSVTVQVAHVGGKAQLDVIDTGIGIPAGDLTHVFERFFRVEKGRSREMGGAGLGLSIVKSICTAHAATLDVTSVEGQGSRFRIALPLALSASKRAPELKEVSHAS